MLETLYQLVAIHIEETNHFVVDVWDFPVNHSINLLKEISTADIPRQEHMFSDSKFR